MQIHMGKGFINKGGVNDAPSLCAGACIITHRCVSPTYCLREGHRETEIQEGLAGAEVQVSLLLHNLLMQGVHRRPSPQLHRPPCYLELPDAASG